MASYAHWLLEGSRKYEVAIHAWIFMSNHVHLLITPSCGKGVSRLMQYMGRRYAQPFNFKYNRTGPLFDGRFKSSVVQDRIYLLNCIQYIELNPVRAGITNDPADYAWSSYGSHAFGRSTKIWTPHGEYLGLGLNPAERQKAYRELVSARMSVEVVHKVRHCLNTGRVLGTEVFREQIAALRN